MNYTDEEKKLIINHKNRVVNQIQKQKEIENDIKDYEKRINQLKRKKSACKGQQTKSKKLINSIVCKKFIEECPDDIMGLILNKLYKDELGSFPVSYCDKSIINMACLVNNKFRTIISERFNFIKIIQKNYLSHKILLIPFQSNLCNKIDNKILEQLLYIPHKPYGRSLIHLFVRNNKLDIMKYLVSKFNNLNINVPTEVDGWLPIHNALWFNNNLINFLINLGIKDDWNFSNGTNCNFDDIYHYIGWLKIYKKNNGPVYLNLDDFKQNIENNKDKIDLQTKIDYDYLIKYEQVIVYLISKIYEYLNHKIKLIDSFEIL